MLSSLNFCASDGPPSSLSHSQGNSAEVQSCNSNPSRGVDEMLILVYSSELRKVVGKKNLSCKVVRHATVNENKSAFYRILN